MGSTANALSQRLSSEGGFREQADDFFCLRYRVWYSSFDCAVRTHFDTAMGCRNCDQGRFNHHRHRMAIRPGDYRLPIIRD